MARHDEMKIGELQSSHLDATAAIEQVSNASPWSRSLFEGELGLTSAERLWVVGEIGDTVVGFAGAMFVGDDVHIMNVAVDPERRRRGLGQTLVAELLRRSIANGGRHATLEVRESNEAAIELYRRFRLGPVGIRSSYYPDGEDALILWAHDIDSTSYSALLKRLSGRSGVIDE